MNKLLDYYYSDSEGWFVGKGQTINDKKGVPLLPYYGTIEEPFNKDGYWDKLNFNTKTWVLVKKPDSIAEIIEQQITCIANSPKPHEQELKAIMEALVSTDSEHYRTTVNSEMVMSIEAIPEKTEEEKRAEKETEMRAQRDALLTATDFYLMSDYPISEEDLNKIKEYRQTLRDMPQQEEWPYMDFPVNPLEDN